MEDCVAQGLSAFLGLVLATILAFAITSRFLPDTWRGIEWQGCHLFISNNQTSGRRFKKNLRSTWMKNLMIFGVLFAVAITVDQDDQQTSQGLMKLDKNNNGYVELVEAVADIAVLNSFARLDINKDKRLSHEELQRWSTQTTSREQSKDLAQKQEQGRL